MKRLLASLMIVPLLLVACSDDEGKDKDQSSNKDQTTQKDKKADQDKQKDNKAKDSKEKDNKAKDTQSNDNGASSSDVNQGTNDGQSTTESQQNQNQADQGQSSTQDQQNNATNGNGNGQNQTSQSSSQSQPKYVAPYQGQNVTPVAQNIVRQQVDRQQALRHLPNFQTSLDSAQAEVNRLNGQNNPYNDYALQGDGNRYSYMFSFINQSQPGTYTIVTVDGTGHAKIVDPAYRQ
ncbi:hypothetical protein MPU07_001595 [Staphylococcus pseudintermedius]|uniref:Lipoprotein n=2 Tax=Staphylococcus pseudintermedius TaxID=283734 RepID=A0A2P5PAD7_STAPS|nr:hypothetical protein [Staphylococcus pseudintermedius]ADV06569.1 lipoprotein precursor [Staphylococcus pseudintermedius HKU10-03]EGQ0289674.1 hypothetical protein [Staphylococcus pseudintermedius]EGQ0291818.1 hypothetical protein [Staphylococcus pseudintermedius]EGQ0300971.1 hypothetical protein [Staphylococcus pseudintermedius]EGQ0311986.1 hypothetical protein [Staphylococcus pseudintermedius]